MNLEDGVIRPVYCEIVRILPTPDFFWLSGFCPKML